jgi:hypothetical protein
MLRSTKCAGSWLSDEADPSCDVDNSGIALSSSQPCPSDTISMRWGYARMPPRRCRMSDVTFNPSHSRISMSVATQPGRDLHAVGDESSEMREQGILEDDRCEISASRQNLLTALATYGTSAYIQESPSAAPTRHSCCDPLEVATSVRCSPAALHFLGSIKRTKFFKVLEAIATTTRLLL